MKQNRRTDPADKGQKIKLNMARLGFRRLSARDMFLMLYDFVAVSLAYFLALWFRFDGNFSEIPQDYLFSWLKFTPFYAVVAIFLFCLFHLYQSIWRFASFVEMKRVFYSTSILAVIHAVAITLLVRRMPISYYLFGAGFQFLLVVIIRFSYRFILLEKSKHEKLVSVTRSMTINNLQMGFPHVFESMVGFSSVCMQAFESLYNQAKSADQELDVKRLLN